ncbi:putative actin patch assembly and actin polymerization protein [Haplosporangium sp. Z 767]|nr:putative actin patch assembly and actin polymerization protein [Haplosporangium sp. Z 767]KAF9193000.1 putative actin patch assembly and actin polymerization protein [Haplosporangium sp. Z 11]
MGIFTKQSAISGQIGYLTKLVLSPELYSEFDSDVITNLASITNWETVASLCEAVNNKDDGIKRLRVYPGTDFSLDPIYCHIINDTETKHSSAKDAAKALRKKLRHGRPQQQMNALTLIQAMVDGCGSKFKAQLATSKFAEDIEAVIIADATDANVKIRLMERLEVWATSFSEDPGLSVIPQLYYGLIKNNTPRQNGSRNSPPSPTRAALTPEQQMRQMAQDIELARNNAHMLIEAVSFADPELEAIEENDLIKRGIQQYLSEMTESATPNEQWLTSLLACNQELVQAFTAYNQMMERHHMSKVTKASEMVDVVPSHAAEVPLNGQNGGDLISFGEADGASIGAGVGDSVRNGHPHSNGNGVSNGNGKSVATTPQTPADPFADEPYFVTNPADVAAAVKMGKRTDNQNKIFDASAYLKQQQLEQEQLHALKEQQRLLHLQQQQQQQQYQQQQQPQSSPGSSQAASISSPVAAIP